MGRLNIRNNIKTFSQIKRKRVSWYHVIWEETIYFCVVSAPLSWLSSTPKSLLAVWFLPNIANILQLTFILGWNLSEKRKSLVFIIHGTLGTSCTAIKQIYIVCISPFFSWIHIFFIVLFCDIMEGAVIPASSSISGLNFWQKCAFQIQFGDSFMSGMWWYTEWYANTSQEKKD